MNASSRMIPHLVIFALISSAYARDANVLTTEVFAIVLDPPMFNWTYEGIEDQFVYQASLLKAPDLPSWINYVYSERHHSGFLYGVPSNKNKAIVILEVIALYKKTYDTKTENISIIISEKLNPARYEVHLKIDNLNVEDMFDVERMEALKDIFHKQLWKNSENDLYVTFLNSAVELGARKPLRPSEGEGVVIRLGSVSEFSTELIELQEEVRPLWKVPACPRDFKRTSVERYFRDAGFALDWCSFRLIGMNNPAIHYSDTNKNLSKLDELFEDINDHWLPLKKSEVPQRASTNGFLPLFFLIILFVKLVLALTFLLCVFHAKIEDEESEEYFDNLFHICTDYYYNHYIYRRAKDISDIPREEINQFETILKATESLRNFSSNREISLSPYPLSHTNSPTSTVSHGMHCRPSPPPYVKPMIKSEL